MKHFDYTGYELLLVTLCVVCVIVGHVDYCIIFLIGYGIGVFNTLHRSQIPQTNTRYHRLKQNGGTHTHAQWLALKRRYAYRCANPRCRALESIDNPLTKDHIVPVSKGGKDTITNIQPLCQSCNSSKGTRIVRYDP